MAAGGSEKIKLTELLIIKDELMTGRDLSEQREQSDLSEINFPTFSKNH